MNIALLGDGMNIMWDWRLPTDIFLGGMGAGAFMVAVVLSYYNSRYRMLNKLGAYIAPVAVALGLLLLLWELGRPGRFYLPITSFKSSSVLAWGILIQVLFLIAAVIYALQVSRAKEEAPRGLWAVLGLALAVLVALYHGAFFAVLAARPLWSSALLPVLSLATSVALGISAILLLASLVGDKEGMGQVYAKLNRALVVSLGAATVMLLLHVMTLANGTLEAKEHLALLLSNYGGLFWVGAVFIGLIIPILLGAIGIYTAATSEGQTVSMGLPLLVAILVLVGGYILRYVIIIGGQGLPLLHL